MPESGYQGREFEYQGHRECDPPGSFFGPEALQTDNAPGLVNESRNRRDSSEGILGTGKPPEHRLSCKQSNR